MCIIGLHVVGQPVYVVNAGSEGEFETAFVALARQGVGGLLLGTDTDILQSPRPAYRAGGALRHSGDLHIPRVRRGWRLDQLRTHRDRNYSARAASTSG